MDLVTSEQTGKLSSILIWQNIAYAAITYVFTQTELTWELLLCYGAVVGANSVAIFWIRKHYASMDSGQLANSNVGDANNDNDSGDDVPDVQSNKLAKRIPAIKKRNRRAF